MLEQADIFAQESERLFALIENWDEHQLAISSGFKGWSANDVLQHLHIWNEAAALSLVDDEAFKSFLKKLFSGPGLENLRQFEDQYLEGLTGTKLRETWRAGYKNMAVQFAKIDPKKRLPWVGPSMSARSSVTARLMETWSHAQALYDMAAVDRIMDEEAIRNITILGVNTYGWTFAVREREAPQPMPYLELTAPSGELWKFGEASENEKISGPAAFFCQVVTQCRNIDDVGLEVVGKNAQDWMKNAQCFAGGAHQPPAPGVRRKALISQI